MEVAPNDYACDICKIIADIHRIFTHNSYRRFALAAATPACMSTLPDTFFLFCGVDFGPLKIAGIRSYLKNLLQEKETVF